ncbi:hypothetical protein [Achromobacter sp. NFACC18-2]|uniref:hypothetical protein n=1 Tax=Achromobacter sp. NFACC18-2 TaxID=1564112 RepID=UPI0011140AA6|nr:hypothetical protein [Achromobacter sp. NFACC18-2]
MKQRFNRQSVRRTTISKKAAARGNTVKFPCHKGASGTGHLSENMMTIFLRGAAAASEGPLYDALLHFDVTSPSSDKVANSFFVDASSNSTQREANKGWWDVHWNKLKKWGAT